MSRIHEALTRAADAPDVVHDQHEGAVTPESGSPVDPSALDRYATESAPSAAEAPPPARTSQLRQVDAPAAPIACHPSWSDTLVLNPGVAPIMVEQYRRLAAVMEEVQFETGLKTLMVSSALPGEGKTLTIVNLALTLSESFHRRVLLIDADLRRPSIHNVFGCPTRQGSHRPCARRPNRCRWSTSRRT